MTAAFDLAFSAAKLIERHEGRRHRMYHDTTGHPTIGVGFNLCRPGAVADLARVGASRDALLERTTALTDRQIDDLLAVDVAEAIHAARRACRQFDSLRESAQIALVDMAFNLGSTGLLGFVWMMVALNGGDYESAAKAAQDSKWATQVGQRAKNIAALLRGQDLPEVVA